MQPLTTYSPNYCNSDEDYIDYINDDYFTGFHNGGSHNVPFYPVSQSSMFRASDEKANTLIEKKLYQCMEPSEIRQLRNETFFALNHSFDNAFTNFGQNSDKQSVKLPLTPSNIKNIRNSNLTKFDSKLQFGLTGIEKDSAKKYFSSLNIADQITIINWIEQFYFFERFFVSDLIAFLVKYPNQMDTCKSFLNTPDHLGLDNINVGNIDRINLTKKFMIRYDCEQEQLSSLMGMHLRY